MTPLTKNTTNTTQSPEAQLLRTLPAIARAIAAEVRRTGGDVQLTMPQFSALRLLAGRDCSVSDIATTLHVATPTVTQNIDGMVSKELVKRYRDDRDRRLVLVRITKKGRSALAKATRSVEAYLGDLLTSVPKERQVALAQAAQEILDLVKVARSRRGS